MTSQQMYQLFQTLWDQIDSQAYPEMYPEQVFDFINQVRSIWYNQARKDFEQSSLLTDLTRTLVKDVYVDNSEGVTPSDEAIYPLDQCRQAETGEIIGYGYLVATKFASCTLADGRTGRTYLKEQSHNQRSATQQSPYGEPKPHLCYFHLVNNTLKVDTNPALFTLGRLRLTILELYNKVSKTENCNLPEQLHEGFVLQAVDLAKESLKPVQQ